MLKVHNLSKKFDKNTALKNVSFEIKKGEILSLIGPNSSGKTTLIKCILGLSQPTSGSVTVDGLDITRYPMQAKQIMGYIPDEPNVWNYMTGGEFLNFTQALFKNTESNQISSHTEELLTDFSLLGTENNYFEDYSRGNKQKYSIIAAMSHNPKLLLIDEPIVGLDPTGAEIAKKQFMSFSKNGGSILLVTHTLSVAEEISDRIGILKNGTLIALGTLSELRKIAKQGNETTLDTIYKVLTTAHSS